jgi:hypothetical protein
MSQIIGFDVTFTGKLTDYTLDDKCVNNDSIVLCTHNAMYLCSV